MYPSSGAPVPARTVAQRQRALSLANYTRVARKELKRELGRGTVRLSDVLRNPPDWLLTAPVHDLLMATPQIGEVRARKFLAAARISSAKRIGGMTDRQADDLSLLLANRA
jgi:hypothetical protein